MQVIHKTIFLNKKHQHLWSMDEIKKDKIGEPSCAWSNCLADHASIFSSHRLVAPAL